MITGDAVIQLAGETGKQGRQITAPVDRHHAGARRIDADGADRRDGVELTFPAEAGVRRPDDHGGDPRRQGRAGPRLTRALFTGSVQFRERGPELDRARDVGDARRRPEARHEHDRERAASRRR